MMKTLAGFKSGLISISILIAGNFIGQIPAQAIGTKEEAAATAALIWIKCNDTLRERSNLYKEAEDLFRSASFDTNLLLDSRLDAIAQASVDDNPLKICERFMGFRLKTSLINASKKIGNNFQYMANWKKKSAERMADYWCKHRTLELTDSQLDNFYDDIILILKQEGVRQYVDDYAIESALLEISEAAGVVVFKRSQDGTCQIFN